VLKEFKPEKQFDSVLRKYRGLIDKGKVIEYGTLYSGNTSVGSIKVLGL
jgi:hypothetical protein